MPMRVQRKRTKGWKMPENTIYVGRPTKWGNPAIAGKHGVEDAEHAVEVFQNILIEGDQEDYPMPDEITEKLRGKNLACWCALDKPCHADILLKIANQQHPSQMENK